MRPGHHRSTLQPVGYVDNFVASDTMIPGGFPAFGSSCLPAIQYSLTPTLHGMSVKQEPQYGGGDGIQVHSCCGHLALYRLQHFGATAGRAATVQEADTGVVVAVHALGLHGKILCNSGQ
jgi:hypothetical protein